MDIEALTSIIVPLAFFALVGGLITLKMLKPYGDRILELIKEIQKDRHEALSQTRDYQQIHERMDMLAERQEFLEALVKNRLEAEELEGAPQRELPGSEGDAGSGSPDAAGDGS